ncbi:UNVERIFIED_CONTAM: hypothetical protein HDU68_003502 [Siphonaria sp. JEL0065]|nr:hypothetical protein HDU68_003502 [Siphonaria sp. JEL0065]
MGKRKANDHAWAEQNRQHQRDYRIRQKERLAELERKAESLQRELDAVRRAFQADPIVAAPSITTPVPSLPSLNFLYNGEFQTDTGTMAPTLTMTGNHDFLSIANHSPTASVASELNKLRTRIAEAETENASLRALLFSGAPIFRLETFEPANPPQPPLQPVAADSILTTQTNQAYREANDAVWNDFLNFGSDEESETGAADTDVGSNNNEQHLLDVPSMKDELKHVSCLAKYDKLIDEFCDYLTTRNILSMEPTKVILKINSFKNRLVQACSTNIHDQMLVESLSLEGACTLPDAVADSTEAVADEMKRLRSIQSLAVSADCLGWIRELEVLCARKIHVYKSCAREDICDVEFLKLKHLLLNHVSDKDERDVVFDVLLSISIY